MPSEIVPCIGGGRNWILTPVFLSNEGVGVANASGEAEGLPDAAGAALGAGVPAGVGETVALTVTVGGVAVGAGDSCPTADPLKPNTPTTHRTRAQNAILVSIFDFRFSNFPLTRNTAS
jgi:hypothetical protein